METIISSMYNNCESFENISHLNRAKKIYMYAVRGKTKTNDRL